MASGPPAPDARLIVMAKHPVPGRVKTRLARALGADAACALFRVFILDLAERLVTLPYEVTWAYWPPEAPFATLVPGARCRPQRGDDLGARMAEAFAVAFAEGTGPVVMIGADVPHVPDATLAEAVRVLRGAADVALGPAADGGYYLIGLAAPAPALFEGVAWGTDDVLRATLTRAAGHGLRVHLVPASFDVDEVEDVERLRAAVVRGDVRLPRTAVALGLPAPRS